MTRHNLRVLLWSSLGFACFFHTWVVFAVVPAMTKHPVHPHFFIASDTFSHNQSIPKDNTCHGENRSPDLHWENAPVGTQTFVLIVSDPDTGHGIFYHWIVFNIPATVHGLKADLFQLPSGAIAGKNSFNQLRYDGPCPPAGRIHRYVFTLYAIDRSLRLAPGSSASAVIAAMQPYVLAKNTLIGLYGH